MNNSIQKIGVIGLGAMGMGIAQSLIRAVMVLISRPKPQATEKGGCKGVNQ
ncbi:exported protein of unknown function [Xenorhabdus doucetiae]|uniref:3-hydroxyacyl-CoA dehydrogenase NAD binding domain-containing protein n=1 Tax=Xenorhabdus doucetiae TaxID=351671 RepID=A0A068QVT9_9GAMM|nr:hypothetical protein LY16_02659 [Xenorhabdus doucetiae]CDG18904.1 exported protein of unknown function [Xenorhabdus doucetiae]